MPVRKESRDVQKECRNDEGCAQPIHNKCGDKHENDTSFGEIIQNGRLFGKFELDDVLLLVIILVLLFDECDDNLLILALGFVFLSGIMQE